MSEKREPPQPYKEAPLEPPPEHKETPVTM